MSPDAYTAAVVAELIAYLETVGTLESRETLRRIAEIGPAGSFVQGTALDTHDARAQHSQGRAQPGSVVDDLDEHPHNHSQTDPQHDSSVHEEGDRRHDSE